VVYTLVDAQRDNAQTLLLPFVVNLFYNYSKLYNKSNVNRRKYCQLSSTDDSHHLDLSRRAVAKISRVPGGSNLIFGSMVPESPYKQCTMG